MTAPHTPVLKPGQPLTAETVGLVLAGDLTSMSQGLARFAKSEAGGVTVTLLSNGEEWNCDYSAVRWLGRPDADGWIAHDGGENPVPGMRVAVKCVVLEHGNVLSDDLEWSGENFGLNIIAWRPERPHVPPQSEGRGKAIKKLCADYHVMHTAICHMAGTSGAIGRWYYDKANEAFSKVTPLYKLAGELAEPTPSVPLSEWAGDAMTEREVRQWIDVCNHEPARQVLRDYLELRSSTPSTRADDDLLAELRGMARECMETMDEAQADVLIRAATALEGRQSTRAEAEPAEVWEAAAKAKGWTYSAALDAYVHDDFAEALMGWEDCCDWSDLNTLDEARAFLSEHAQPAADADKLRIAREALEVEWLWHDLRADMAFDAAREASERKEPDEADLMRRHAEHSQRGDAIRQALAGLNGDAK